MKKVLEMLAPAAILSIFAITAAKADTAIETAGQLSDACKIFLQKTARQNENALGEPDACKDFLRGFAGAYGVRRDVSLETRIKGTLSDGSNELPCFRMPDYLSFRDFARLSVEYIDANAALNAEPAHRAVAAALARKYPCPRA